MNTKPALRLVPPPDPAPVEVAPAGWARPFCVLVWALLSLVSLAFGFLSDATAQAAEAAGKLGGE